MDLLERKEKKMKKLKLSKIALILYGTVSHYAFSNSSTVPSFRRYHGRN